jgi:ribonuclease HIII
MLFNLEQVLGVDETSQSSVFGDVAVGVAMVCRNF